MKAHAWGAFWAVAVVLAVSCVTPQPPLPPITSVGDPITGRNPEVPVPAGTRTKVVTYGPWTIPAATGAGHHEAGMIEDVKLTTPKPCDDCYVISAVPQLRNRDGSVANVDTGVWLHHFALFSSGGVDARCSQTAAGLVGEVFFTGANERTPGTFPPGVGYRTRPTDRWALLVDLMNTGATTREVVFEVTYQWVPASTPGMHHARPVILDVGTACVDSTRPQQPGQFSYSSTWEVTVPGRVVGLAAHTHDGGTNVTLRNRTTGELICDSEAFYGGPGFEAPADPEGTDGDGHGHGHGGATHLSGMGQCLARGVDRPIAVINRGDVLEIEAHFDLDRYAPVPDEPVMGLYFMYVIPEEQPDVPGRGASRPT